jgi:hypothetical protein
MERVMTFSAATSVPAANARLFLKANAPPRPSRLRRLAGFAVAAALVVPPSPLALDAAFSKLSDLEIQFGWGPAVALRAFEKRVDQWQQAQAAQMLQDAIQGKRALPDNWTAPAACHAPGGATGSGGCPACLPDRQDRRRRFRHNLVWQPGDDRRDAKDALLDGDAAVRLQSERLLVTGAVLWSQLSRMLPALS